MNRNFQSIFGVVDYKVTILYGLFAPVIFACCRNQIRRQHQSTTFFDKTGRTKINFLINLVFCNVFNFKIRNYFYKVF